MKAVVVFVSKNPEYGIVSIKGEGKGFGFIKDDIEIASGWCKIEAGTTVGEETQIPDDVKVTTRMNGDFEWLVLS